MDLYNLVNSVDIREYHKNIGYKYNSLEAAWLVYQCQSLTIPEKHDVWQWIVSNMPDVEVTHSFIWGESKSFAYYTGDFYELPNNDGWDRCDGSLSSIRLKRIHKNYEASIEVLLFPLFISAARYGIERVKTELLNEPIIKCMMIEP